MIRVIMELNSTIAINRRVPRPRWTRVFKAGSLDSELKD